MNRAPMSTAHLELRGACADLSPGSTLETAAVQLSKDIAELRRDGGIPDQVHTVIAILPQQRVLEIQVEGLSVQDDPDRTTIRAVAVALFELASYHNVASLDDGAAPLFTVRILLVDSDGRPFSALIGTAVGDVEAAPTVPADPANNQHT